MNPTPSQELEVIKDEIQELLRMARQVLRDQPNDMIRSRAHSYWLAHIECALDNDHTYLGRDMFTMQDAINDLHEQEYCALCGSSLTNEQICSGEYYCCTDHRERAEA